MPVLLGAGALPGNTEAVGEERAVDGWKIITGDCLESLRSMPAESVHCCITSPPYWGGTRFTPTPLATHQHCPTRHPIIPSKIDFSLSQSQVGKLCNGVNQLIGSTARIHLSRAYSVLLRSPAHIHCSLPNHCGAGKLAPTPPPPRWGTCRSAGA